MEVMTWEVAIKFVLDREGGYTWDPVDPGGETNFGICKRDYPALDIKNLTVDQAKEIYRKNYWEVCACDQLPPKIAIAVFDCAVNQGTGIAKRLLQIALGVAVDGHFGPVTIAAAHKPPIQKTLTMFLTRRAMRYTELILKNPKLEKFSIDWHFRLFKLAELVLKDE